MRCFRIVDSFRENNRWYLDSPRLSDGVEIDPGLFTEGHKYDGESVVEIPISDGWEPLDFTLGSFDMPVVATPIAKRIQASAPDSIQRVPVKMVGGHAGYEIINVLSLLTAINDEHSEIRRWTEKDGYPEKIGEYFGIGKLVLNGPIVDGHHIFRLTNWELPLIVSEKMKENLEELATTGIAFEELQTLY